MKLFIMAVGVPGSGKSTAIKKYLETNAGIVLSTDDYIETVAASKGTTYDKIFKDTIKQAEENLLECLELSLKTNQSRIIWDQTNVSAKIRAKRLALIPDDYVKVAWFFETPEKEEWKSRLDSRPGKSIPFHVLESMAGNLERPTKEEGFDYVLTIPMDI